MSKRGNNRSRENVPVTGTGRSTSAEPTVERISHQKANEKSRLKNIASGILAKNENAAKGGGQMRRVALADKKNMVSNEANKKTGKNAGETSKLAFLTSKLRRSFSASPKRSRSKSSDNARPENRITLRKGLAELVPRITAGGMRLRARRISGPCAPPNGGDVLKQKPAAVDIESVEEQVVQKPLLKPLPFVNGKRSLDDQYNNEVVYCEQYAADNWDYLFYIEGKGAVQPNFLSGSRITPTMRMATLDWITRVQIGFKLLPETQLTTVNLFDRCLMARRFTVDKKQLQLIALGCAVVAAKYEEIYPPDISEYLASCDSTKQEIHHAEMDVLSTVNFELNYPRTIQFIRRLTEHYDLSVHTLAKAISDVATYDYNTCHLLPSVNAAVAVYVAAYLEGIEFPEKLCNLARVPKVEIEKLAPVFANAVIDLLRTEKCYSAIYKRMFKQRKLVFSSDQISQLSRLAKKSSVQH